MRKPEEILKDLEQLAEDVQSPDVIWPYEWNYYANAMADLERELREFTQSLVDREAHKA